MEGATGEQTKLAVLAEQICPEELVTTGAGVFMVTSIQLVKAIPQLGSYTLHR